MAVELRAAIRAYHALLDHDRARSTDRRLRAAIDELGMTVHGGRPVCSVLRPRFVTEAQLEALLRAAAGVGTALQKLGRALLQDARLRAPYRLSADEERLLQLDPGYDAIAPFGRLDGFLSDDGDQVTFIEPNLESPAGIAYDEALASVFEDLEPMREFSRRYRPRPIPVRRLLQDFLLEIYTQWGGHDTPTVAIVDFGSVPTYSEFVYLREQFCTNGLQTLIVEPHELSYDGQQLRAGGTPIDLVYRRVLLNELFEHYNLEHPLIRAYADGKVCVVNPFRTKLLHTKLALALLSDLDGPAAQAADLNEQERAAVRAHIPWTRLLQAGPSSYQDEPLPDLLAFALQNRERLVLKPNDQYGGSGVLLGWETDQQRWEAALAQALEGVWVLQERVAAPQEDYPSWSEEYGLEIKPRYVDSDPCLFGNRAAGCLTRISASALMNVSAGGGSAPPTFLI